MYLYLYNGFSGGADRQLRTEELVIRSVEKFAAENCISFDGVSREICRTEKGKPYFKELPLEFSVSHTGSLWVCLISEDGPVGVDIQMIKETRQERIAARYFTAKEQESVKQAGAEAFFSVWTRKEAYAKYTGKGITKELAEISVIDNRDLVFDEFEIGEGVKGAFCAEKKGDLCIRMI